MGMRTGSPGDAGPDRESYAKVLANPGVMLAAIAVLGFVIVTDQTTTRPSEPPKPPAVAPTVASLAPKALKPAKTKRPDTVAAPPPAPAPEAPKLDREAVARAEESLDAASRDRERAEARAEEAARKLAAASVEAAAEAKAAKSLALRVRDPSTRINQAAAKGGFLRGEREKLKTEIATLATIPRPKAKVLSNKNPVARPSDGEEFHFELRRNRVTYIDLEGLLRLVKADAMLKIRLADGARTIDSRVGPIGAFSLEYSMGRSFGGSLDDLMDRRRISFDLRGWEIVPEFEGRGEAYDATRQPVSAFSQAINRLSPQKSTITMWVYPDSFALFRKLREDLQNRGFLVAARPLPEAMAIRGSPSGSLSAGQ